MNTATGIYMPSNYTGADSIFLKEAAKVIYAHKEEFDEWIRNGQKLMAVKTLKEYTSGGLKESKDAFDLYCVLSIDEIFPDSE